MSAGKAALMAGALSLAAAVGFALVTSSMILFSMQVEYALLALLVGVVAGLGARAAHGGRRARRLAVPAVAAALVGFLLERVLGLVLVAYPYLGLLQILWWHLAYPETQYDLIDILWLVVAGATAWLVTRPRSPRQAAPV